MFEKSQVVHLEKRENLEQLFSFNIGSMNIKTVERYKYLGVTLNGNLDFSESAQELAEAGGWALGGIISKFKVHKNFGYHTFTKLFDHGVKPITDYYSSIWGFASHTFPEKVQLRAARYFMGVNPKTPILVLTGDMGWLTTKVRIFLEIIKYYNQLIKMDHSRLTYKVFENDLQHISNENWSGDLETILNQIGMTENLFTGTEIDLDLAKEKISVVSDLDWQESIAYKPKLRTYTKCKGHIGTKIYLVINLTRLQISLVHKLRSSTLQLVVEKGRYKKEELSQRACVFFDEVEIEDQINFVVQCPRCRIIGITFSHTFVEIFKKKFL